MRDDELPTPRSGHALRWITFFVVSGVGLTSTTVTAVLGAGVGTLLLGAGFALGGAALATFGIRAIQSPTTLSLSDNQGTDASGHQQWGPSRPATEEQGRMIGVVCLLLGLAIAAIGPLVGAALPS